MKKILVFIIFIFATNLSAQTNVDTYRSGLTKEGVTYFLPRTGIHITLRATRTTHTPGEYYKYASRFLRLNDVPTTTYDSWTLDKIEMHPFGVADSSRVYTIALNPKSAAPLVTLTDDCRLLSVNKEVPLPAPLTSKSVTHQAEVMLNPSDYKTEEILSATSLMKMAELTAEEILDIRENRSLLAKGQADFLPKDGEQLRLMLNSLEQQEDALMQCFKGTTKVEHHVITLDVIPTDEIDEQILFRFSRHKGYVDADDLSGEPYAITIKNLRTLPAAAPQAEESKRSKSKEKKDLRYILPERAMVTLTHNGHVIHSLEIPIAQWGRVECLGGDLFNKKFSTRITLSPQTGSIVSIEGEPVK